jgi:hypothetical protein
MLELTRLSRRADFESHKFNSGLNDEGILKSALKEQKKDKTHSFKRAATIIVAPPTLL